MGGVVIGRQRCPRGVKDITGEQRNNLRVEAFIGVKDRYALWRCVCSCGKIINLTSKQLLTRKTCGCIDGKFEKGQNTTHGASSTRLYSIWSCMLGRCYNENNTGILPTVEGELKCVKNGKTSLGSSLGPTTQDTRVV